MRLNYTTETPGLVCVECGYETTHTCGNGRPGPGDFSLCIKCGSLSVFDAEMKFRRPTDDEIFAAAKDAGIQKLRRAILSIPRAERDN